MWSSLAIQGYVAISATDVFGFIMGQRPSAGSDGGVTQSPIAASSLRLRGGA